LAIKPGLDQSLILHNGHVVRFESNKSTVHSAGALSDLRGCGISMLFHVLPSMDVLIVFQIVL
jgi:hypothetical protein